MSAGRADFSCLPTALCSTEVTIPTEPPRSQVHSKSSVRERNLQSSSPPLKTRRSVRPSIYCAQNLPRVSYSPVPFRGAGRRAALKICSPMPEILPAAGVMMPLRLSAKPRRSGVFLNFGARLFFRRFVVC